MCVFHAFFVCNYMYLSYLPLLSVIVQLDLGPYPTMKSARGIVRVRDWAIPQPGYQAVAYSVPPFGPDFDPDTALYA